MRRPHAGRTTVPRFEMLATLVIACLFITIPLLAARLLRVKLRFVVPALFALGSLIFWIGVRRAALGEEGVGVFQSIGVWRVQFVDEIGYGICLMLILSGLSVLSRFWLRWVQPLGKPKRGRTRLLVWCCVCLATCGVYWALFWFSPTRSLYLAMRDGGDIGRVRWILTYAPWAVNSPYEVVYPQRKVYPFRAAVSIGNTEIVEYLLANGANWTEADKKRGELLMLAAGTGKVEMVELLFRHGQTPGIMLVCPFNPWSRKTSIEVFDFLFAKGIRCTPESMQDALLFATERLPEAVGRLLDEGASPALPDRAGRVPLKRAAELGNVKVASLLLDRGAPVDPTQEGETSALYVATFAGHYGMVAHLLERGASPNTGPDRYRPLMAAVQRGDILVVRRLLEAGADTNFPPSLTLITPVVHSLVSLRRSETELVDMLELLLEHGLNIQQQSVLGKTALHKAVEKEKWELVQALVSRGARADIPDDKGRTALDLCPADKRHLLEK